MAITNRVTASGLISRTKYVISPVAILVASLTIFAGIVGCESKNQTQTAKVSSTGTASTPAVPPRAAASLAPVSPGVAEPKWEELRLDLPEDPDLALLSGTRIVLAQISSPGASADGAKKFLSALWARSKLRTAWGVVIVLHQERVQSLMGVRVGTYGVDNLFEATQLLRKSQRLKEFDLRPAGVAAVEIQFIRAAPAPLAAADLDKSFKLGVQGLRITDGKKLMYVLPTDSDTHHLRNIDDLKKYIDEQFGTGALDQKENALKLSVFEATGYLSMHGDWLYLDRTKLEPEAPVAAGKTPDTGKKPKPERSPKAKK